MNTERNSLRARAANLFAAEARAQELVGMALFSEQTDDYHSLEDTAGHFLAHKPSLEALVLDSDRDILNVHTQLQRAKSRAAQLQAEDKQLNALNQLIYGGKQSAIVEEDVIEGEIVEEVNSPLI